MSEACENNWAVKKEQAHRLLEDLESITLAVRLLNQVVESFGRNFQGILNGNAKK